jgi:hypothetical protein
MMRDPRKARARKELVEHPFAIIKHHMNHDYFLMRGMKNVAAEVSMSVLVFNMKRVMNIVGVSTLIAALQAKRAYILSVLLRLLQQILHAVNKLVFRYCAVS